MMTRQALTLLTLVWCVQNFEDSIQAMLFLSQLPNERMVEAKLLGAPDMGARVYFRADLPPEHKQFDQDGNFVIYEAFQGDFRPAFKEKFDSNRRDQIKAALKKLYPKK